MAKKRATKKKRTRKSKNEDAKLFAFIATFFSILGFIIALLAKRDDKYVMYYAKQSLVVFVGYLVAVILGALPAIGFVLGLIASIIVFILWIFSWVYALSGKMQEVPLVGQYGKELKL